MKRLILAALVTILSLPAFATTYDIRSNADFANIQFALLNDGDTLFFHSSPVQYKARLFITKGVRLIGELAADGTRPVIDAEGSPWYGSELMRVGYQRDFFTQCGCILTGPPYGTRITATYRGPKGIIIRNLTIQGAKNPVLMPDKVGGFVNLGMASGIYSWYSEGMEIDNCLIRDNGNGLFSVGSGQTRDIWIHNNEFTGNGIAGSYRQHQVYIEALGVLFEYNWLHAPRPGMQGMCYKSRSGKEVFRHNKGEDGMLLAGWEDPQEAGYIHTDPGFAETLAEDNEWVVHDGWADYGFHFGDDQLSRNQSPTGFYADGTPFWRHPEKSRPHLTFRNNKITVDKLKGRFVWFDLRAPKNTVDATGNTITTTHPIALYLVNDNGTLNLSGNTLPAYRQSLRPLKGTISIQ